MESGRGDTSQTPGIEHDPSLLSGVLLQGESIHHLTSASRADTSYSRGVKLAKDLGLRSIILEGDARLVFEEFESGSMDLSYNGNLIHKICVLSLNFEKFKA